MKKAIVIVLIFLAAAAGVWLGRKPFRHWKQERFLAQARSYLARSDYRNAVFSVRKTLDINHNDPDAFRLMAEINEQVGSPEAVVWRSRLVELEPQVASNRLQLARTALRFGNYAAADHALHGVQGQDCNTPDFHTLVSMVAVDEGNLAAAEAHSAAAVQLDPQNKKLQLNLDVLRLQARDSNRVAAARQSLEALCADPATRRDALRHLVLDSMRVGDFARAKTFSQKLQTETPPVFEDNLMHLGVLKGAGSAGAEGFLAGLEKTAVQNPMDIGSLSAWLMTHGMTDELLRWLASLPVKKPPDRQVTDLMADAYALRGEWGKAQALLQNQDWGELDYLRLAKLALVLRKQGDELQSKADWHSAVTHAEGQMKPLSVLLEQAERWGWQPEKEEVAWLLVRRFPGEWQVLGMLRQLYAANGNTHKLQEVYSEMMRYDSQDTAVRNNFAALSLLLNTDLTRAREIAREDFTRKPQDAVVASTYAFALHLQGHTKEGLELLSKFKESDLEQPAVATYYGVLLASSGQREKARPYLAIAAKSQLLPEEKALVASVSDTPVSAR